MSEKRALTTGEVAQYCSVHIRTVIRWIEQGRLKAYRLPGRGDKRVMVDDFLAFLKVNGMPVPREYEDAAAPRVLIVDDDVSMAAAIQRTLRRAGFDTVAAHDGFVAGSLLATFSPAVMTLDLMMPCIDGLEVLRYVRDQNHLRELKVLVISAMPPDVIEKARRIGVDDVLEKPFDNRVLVGKVSRLAGVETPDAGFDGLEAGPTA